MKMNIIKIQICIFAFTLICSTTFGQTLNKDSLKQASMRDSVRISKIKDSLYNAVMKNSAKVDSSKSKIVTAKQEIKETANRIADKVTPSQPTEVAKVVTPKGNSVSLTADPISESIFHTGSLIVGIGIVYQKDVLPVMIVGEYGIGRNIGVEVRSWYGSNTTDGVRVRDGLFGVGLNYHFTGDINNSRNASDKFDVYVGGLYGKKIEDTGSAFYGQAGARYYFTQRFGVFANFNLGIIGNRGTNLSFGLAYSILN